MAEAESLTATNADRPHYRGDDPDFLAYLRDGERRAMALGNRGPIRLDESGNLHPDVLAAYSRCGFYVFENVVGAAELGELRADVERVVDRAPVRPDAAVDRHGRPALGAAFRVPTFLLVPPLSDPLGGTARNHGRHPVKMNEPPRPDDAPEFVVHMIFGLCQIMDSCLRLYGHPGILGVAAAINGDDFVPYNDAIFIKQPGLGASVAWHQDGIVHWEKPDWDEGTHGFNFMVQLYGSTAGSGVWVVPGTHRQGKLDIRARVAANGGSERLPDAVPLVCGPGDMFMCNRQALHGSFANTSSDLRVTINFGFHRRASVLGAPAALTSKGGVVYDAERIRERARIIALAIDARAQHFRHEPRFVYRPFAGEEDDNRFSEATRASVLDNYNTRDLGI